MTDIVRATLQILLVILILPLSTARVAHLFALEAGPYDVFIRIRTFIFKKSVGTTPVNKFFFTLHKGINCVWCNSVWFGAFFALFVATNPFEWLALLTYYSMIAIVIYHHYGMR